MDKRIAFYLVGLPLDAKGQEHWVDENGKPVISLYGYTLSVDTFKKLLKTLEESVSSDRQTGTTSAAFSPLTATDPALCYALKLRQPVEGSEISTGSSILDDILNKEIEK
jgi:hypothetical protein